MERDVRTLRFNRATSHIKAFEKLTLFKRISSDGFSLVLCFFPYFILNILLAEIDEKFS